MTARNRKVRYAKTIMGDVTNNPAFKFSRGHSLSIYPLDAVFTYIPKNACSTMRYSIAVANGYIDDLSQIEWMHFNNYTFIATLKELATASHTFVVLRCPFRRLASVYMDKFVSQEFKARDGDKPPLPISFAEFVTLIVNQRNEEMNQHWRPQVDFLFYDEYDQYFSMEEFAKAGRDLEQRGFTVHDTRASIGHDTSVFTKIEGAFSRLSTDEIAAMRAAGQVPSHKSLYTDELVATVAKRYRDDLDLYRRCFGASNLLFDA